MRRLFRYFKRDYWRYRGILNDIKSARSYYEEGVTDYMCHAFLRANHLKYYHGLDVCRYIPEFNSDFLVGKHFVYGEPWWPTNDRSSRLEAFDKLIEIYENKIANL